MKICELINNLKRMNPTDEIATVYITESTVVQIIRDYNKTHEKIPLKKKIIVEAVKNINDNLSSTNDIKSKYVLELISELIKLNQIRA